MKNLNTILLTTAKVFRFFHLPHALKYGLFLLVKGKKIQVRSSIHISNITLELNLGEFIEYWIFMDGLYEGEWIIKIQNLVKGKIFIDVGANIGAYTLSLCNYSKHIYAFEPEKVNYKKLNINLKKNSIKNVTLSKKAITDYNGKAKLFKSKVDSGWHSLVVNYTGGEEKVEAITLDSFIYDKKITNIGLIKIDVEGAENKVISGLKKTIRKYHPSILIEFNQPLSKKTGQSLFAIYDFMTKSGYVSYRLRKGELQLFKRNNIKKLYFENILFIIKNTSI